MIKTTAKFSAHIIHVLHVVVRTLSIFLTILLFALFFWLIHGIKVDSLHVGKYKIDGLYIKLDKKLTLMAKEVTLPQSKAKPSFERVDKTFDDIKYLLTFFDTIMLDRINFKNNHITMLYADDVLYITSDIYEIAGNIRRKGEKLIADVSLLYIKKEEVTLSGSLTYDLKTNILETEGHFEAYGLTGNFRAQKRDDVVRYALNTDPFTDVKNLITRTKLPSSISVWITKRVIAKRYKLSYLTGAFHINSGTIEPDIETLQAKVHFDDVTINYKDGVRPVHAKALDLTYAKGTLDFKLIEPKHLDRDLTGSSVQITHIAGGGTPAITIDIHAKSPVDEEVQKILRAYHLHIPVTHYGDDTLHVNLHIPLKKGKKKIGVHVDAALTKGALFIQGVGVAIEKADVHYDTGKVTIVDAVVNEPWLQAKVNGEVTVLEKRVSLKIDTKRFALGQSRVPLILIENKKIPLKASYAKQLKITLPSLGVALTHKPKQWLIDLTQLKKIAPYLKYNLLGVNGGHLTFTSKKMRQFYYKGELRSDVCFLYEKEDRCYTHLPVSGSFDLAKGTFILDAFQKRLHLNLAKGRVSLHGINIDLKVLLSQLKQMPKHTGRMVKRTFVILGKKSRIRYEKYKLLLDSYDIEIAPNGDIKAIGSLNGDIVKFTKNGSILKIDALRITDRMLRPLIHFNGLKQGRYSLHKEGDPNKKMKGRIIIEGGVLSDFKAYSNTLAFINTVPALATLNSPGFSDKGFKIEEGVIEYTMTPEKITFDSVYLKGNSATIVGKGTLLLSSKKIDFKLAIQTVRELGKIVGNIPLLGYILLGDDNSMTVGLKITGTLEKPKVTTSVAKDILTLPIQIIQRTITAPAHLVPAGTKGKKSSPASKNVPQDAVQKGQ